MRMMAIQAGIVLLSCTLWMHTWLSTEMLTTAVSTESTNGPPAAKAEGKKARPVTNMEWAAGTCSTRCRLKATKTCTLPVNMVPMATNRPSSDTASAERLSVDGHECTNEASVGFQNCRYELCLERRKGLANMNSRDLDLFPSTMPNLKI